MKVNKMGQYVGIDLGTTFSAIAHIDATGRPQIINNERDVNITPSVVAKNKGELIIGEFARKTWGNDNRRGAARFKRDMGTSVKYKIEDLEYSPTQLSAEVLKHLKKVTEDKIGTIQEAVITIPANFAHEARDATMEAAIAAGLNVKYIINEPTAAALYYAYQSNGELSGTYVVFDLGGGTFDVSIIKVVGQNVEVLASNGLHKLGGADFDLALWEIIAKKYLAQTKNSLTMNEFSVNDAEDAKRTLSDRKKVTVEIEREFVDISRIDFEESISSMLAQIEMLCETTIDEAEIELSDITSVFFAGGSTRIPVIYEIAKKVFRKDPISTVNVDEVVALGAALYAAHRSDGSNLSEIQKKSINQLKVAERTSCYFGTLSVGYSESKGDVLMNSILIEKGALIPCSVTESFHTRVAGQTSVNCRITESRAPETNPKFVKIIHEEELELPEGREAGQEIKITYSYDVNQIMHATFKDVASGREKVISLSFVNSGNDSAAINKFLVD